MSRNTSPRSISIPATKVDKIRSRFLRYVNKNGPVMPGMKTSCWTWTAFVGSDGYGQFTILGAVFQAHRIAWVLSHGDLQSGVMVLHRCDNRSCVRSGHLFGGDHDDNVRDATLKHRVKSGENHWNAVLTRKLVARVRSLLSSGKYSQAEVSRMTGVGTMSVSLIKRNKAWRLP